MPEQPTPSAVAAPPAEEPKPDPLAASVAAAVSKLRREAGLSERAAAKKLGTSQTQLRRMEDPRYLPSLRSLARVANAYGAHLLVSFESQEAWEKWLAEEHASSPRGAPGRVRAGARRPARGAARRRKAR